MTPLRSKLEQSLAWIALILLLGGCLLVLQPFFSAALWAIVLTYACWPVYRRVDQGLRGRHTLAALVMALGLICVILLPFVVVGMSLGDNVNELAAAARRWVESGSGTAPAWLQKVPLVGQWLADYWHDLAGDRAKLLSLAKSAIEPTSHWAVTAGVALGLGLFQLALSILISFFLFRDAGGAGKSVVAAVTRVAGERGAHLLALAGSTVRGVVYGILGTALVQAVMAGIGFIIAGVPGAALLALLTFLLSVVPVGPPLVWLPAALWLFAQGSHGWGIFMLIWGVAVSSVDNVVKPWIISQGNAMPFLLIFFGVFGGALAFGFIGVFLGPTLLAVGYRLITEWAASRVPASPESPAEATTPSA